MQLEWNQDWPASWPLPVMRCSQVRYFAISRLRRLRSEWMWCRYSQDLKTAGSPVADFAAAEVGTYSSMARWAAAPARNPGLRGSTAMRLQEPKSKGDSCQP